MGFWIFMTCCTLLIPVLMVCAGAALREQKRAYMRRKRR